MLTDQDLAAVLRDHFPRPPASSAELAEFEARWGVRLDPDLEAFYRASNGARLFAPVDAPYRILPLDQIIRARAAIYGEDESEYGPPSLLAICDVEDGNYVAIDTSSSEGGCFPVLDVFHETFPEQAERISASFGEFLHQALHNGGRHFWID